jgi:hypothetical protein
VVRLLLAVEKVLLVLILYLAPLHLLVEVEVKEIIALAIKTVVQVVAVTMEEQREMAQQVKEIMVAQVLVLESTEQVAVVVKEQ